MSIVSERTPLVNTDTNVRRTMASQVDWKSVASILIFLTVMFESAAYYSFAGNLVSSLMGNLKWDLGSATMTLLVSAGVMYSFGLLTGWISDAFLGRFKVIAAGFITYIIGYIYFVCVIFIPCSSGFLCINSSNGSPDCVISVYIAVVLISLGAGTVETNIIVFGADMVS